MFHSTTAAANKANRILGLIKKSFNSLNTKSLPKRIATIGHALHETNFGPLRMQDYPNGACTW